MEIKKTTSKFYLLKIYLNCESLQELSGIDASLKLKMKFNNLEYLKDLSNYIKLKRISGFNALIIKPMKFQVEQTNFLSYIAVSRMNLTPSVNRKRLCIEKTIKTITFKFNNRFMIVSIIDTKFDDMIILRLYVPFTRRQYHGKIMTCHLELMIQQLLSQGKVTLKHADPSKATHKKRYLIEVLLKYVHVIFKDFSVYVLRKIDNLFHLSNYVGILKELLYRDCVYHENNLYLLEVLFDITDNIFQHMPSININNNNNYCPSFLIKVSPFKRFGVLNFKVSLKEFIEYVGYTPKNNYNLYDILDMAKFIFNNFIQFWQKIDSEDNPISFSDILYKKKFRLSTASAVHTNRFPLTISKIRYPVLLIQKPFSLKPKQLCIIFLESTELVKVIIYNLTTRKSTDHYFRLAVLDGIFSITEYLVNMNLLEEAGGRLYKIIKNRYLFGKIENNKSGGLK